MVDSKELKMQTKQNQEYIVHYQYWMDYRNSYETDSVVVVANSVNAAIEEANEMGILEIINVSAL
jgi:hypothetical protein